MNAIDKLNFLINDKNLAVELRDIAEKVLREERIAFDEGVLLYEKGELGYLGVLANYIREKRHGDHTFFNRNFHIEPTNVCVYDCKFCSYSRLIKERAEGWEMEVDGMMDIVKKYDNEAVTEVHITGGVVPKQNLEFYASATYQRTDTRRILLYFQESKIEPLRWIEIFAILRFGLYAGWWCGNLSSGSKRADRA